MQSSNAAATNNSCRAILGQEINRFCSIPRPIGLAFSSKVPPKRSSFLTLTRPPVESTTPLLIGTKSKLAFSYVSGRACKRRDAAPDHVIWVLVRGRAVTNTVDSQCRLVKLWSCFLLALFVRWIPFSWRSGCADKLS